MSSKAILQEVITDMRQAMGERPSLEMLIRLREGRLSEEEREQVLERAAVDPEFAKELLDVLDFPNTPAEEDEEQDEELRELRRQAISRAIGERRRRSSADLCRQAFQGQEIFLVGSGSGLPDRSPDHLFLAAGHQSRRDAVARSWRKLRDSEPALGRTQRRPGAARISLVVSGLGALELW